MPSFISNLSGGKAISGGALSPRNRRGNTNQVASYWSGGGLSAIVGQFMVVGGGGGGGNGFNNGSVGATANGGGGGGISISASGDINAGVYTMNVGSYGAVGATGGTSSVVLSGSTLYSATGGGGSGGGYPPAAGGGGGSGTTSNGTAGGNYAYTPTTGGYTSDFDGTSRVYGSGGGNNPGGGGYQGTDYEGDGGSGGGGGNPWGGGRGGYGVAMLKIPTADTSRITAITGTYSTITSGSFTIYKWTVSGTVTIS